MTAYMSNVLFDKWNDNSRFKANYEFFKVNRKIV